MSQRDGRNLNSAGSSPGGVDVQDWRLCPSDCRNNQGGSLKHDAGFCAKLRRAFTPRRLFTETSPLGNDVDGETAVDQPNDCADQLTAADAISPTSAAFVSSKPGRQLGQSPGLSSQSDTVLWRRPMTMMADLSDHCQYAYSHQKSPLTSAHNPHHHHRSIFHHDDSSNGVPGGGDGLTEGIRTIGGTNDCGYQCGQDTHRNAPLETLNPPPLQLIKQRALFHRDDGNSGRRQYDSSSYCASPLGWQRTESSSTFHEQNHYSSAAMVGPEATSEGNSNGDFGQLLHIAWDDATQLNADHWTPPNNMFPQFESHSSHQPAGNAGMQEMTVHDLIFDEVHHAVTFLMTR
mmetsp:Transcript_1760/g.3071  ORF Transcript_1760/g.3071 Transcript_1760/m.3071 type:complete len:347 (-) Transcript_1760:2417-3457(-)